MKLENGEPIIITIEDHRGYCVVGRVKSPSSKARNPLELAFALESEMKWAGIKLMIDELCRAIQRSWNIQNDPAWFPPDEALLAAILADDEDQS
jgi:hypothetical protein